MADHHSDVPDENLTLILAYVDREMGVNPGLSKDEEAKVRQLMDENPRVRELADTLLGISSSLRDIAEDCSVAEES